MPDKYMRWALPCALLAYCLCAMLAILQKPGLQYDEALLVEGAVQMRISPHELTLPHDPDTWVCPFGRCFPLMTVRYVGSAKEYLALLIFAIFGPQTVVLRLVSMLLGGLGIWGIAQLIRDQAGLSPAAITAWILALNPAYVDMTVFDNDAIAMSMAALGILCLAIRAYLRSRTTTTALLAGAAVAYLVWARANLVWMLLALIAAAAIVLRKRLRMPLPHMTAAVLGGVIAGLPFLMYQVVSKGGTWEGLSIFASNDTLRDRLYTRLIMFSETLVSDREHRAMWDGPMMADWQRWLFPAVVLVSCLVCLIRGSRFARIVALTLLFFAAPLFLSRVNLSEHHLIGLLPFAAVVSVLACRASDGRYRWAALALAVVYGGSAVWWQFSAVQGLRRTGGVGPWSDGIYRLATYLEDKYPGREVKILDWGLQNNLFVLTDGRLHSRELYGDGPRRPWIDEIREGGVFLLNGPEHRQFPIASEAFLKTFADSHPSSQRFSIRQRDGVSFAEVIDIQPNSLDQGPVSPNSTVIPLDGFYDAEATGWRWTKRQFALTFEAAETTRLKVQLYVPESIIDKLGPITLSAKAGGHALGSETYRRPGQYTFTRDLEAAGKVRIDFTLDKSLPPSPSDKRELGIVFVTASLEN